jgi:hypothetical protein
MQSTRTDLWTFTDESLRQVDITGFGVEATDGGIGTVDEATHEAGSSYIVVDTGPWIFGKKVLVPAGLVHTIDENDRKIWVNRTKDEIQNAPEFDETRYTDPAYRDELGTYYGRTELAGTAAGPIRRTETDEL